MQEQEQHAASPSALKDVVDTIAEQLGETTPQVSAQLRRLVLVMGAEQSLTFVQKALEVEANGGMMLPDQSRKRTLGGVFFLLVRTQGPKKARALWRKPNPAKNKGTTPHPTPQNATQHPPAAHEPRCNGTGCVRTETTGIKQNVLGTSYPNPSVWPTNCATRLLQS